VAQGYRVVTFNHNASAVWVQVLAATDYLRDQGATTIVVGGASLGAMASLRAAQEPGSGLHGVIWIAGVQLGSGYAFQEEDVAAVACPILFASGTGDEHGAAEDAERMSARAPSAELVLVESELHGTDILLEGGAADDELRAAILGFLDRVTASPGATCD
jgi:dienelactone hydrolase